MAGWFHNDRSADSIAAFQEKIGLRMAQRPGLERSTIFSFEIGLEVKRLAIELSCGRPG